VGVTRDARTRTESVYIALRDAIVTLEMAPGSVVDEAVLARSFGVSRILVRDAINRLNHDRLVRTFPRRGTLVTEATLAQLSQLSEVRLRTESFAASLAAERATREQLDECHRLSELLETAQRSTARAEIVRFDRDVHDLVHRAAGNPFLEDCARRHYSLALRLWHVVADRNGRPEEMLAGHADLLEAIRCRRVATAARVAQRQVLALDASIRRSITASR
jgi:DNA-binding GntR family transcriptional regulator